MLDLYLALALAAAPPAAASAETEILAIDAPDAFQVGSHQRNAQIDMAELVVPPETVDGWSRMITLQLLYGGSARIGVEAFAARWREGIEAACSGATGKIAMGKVDGLAAVRVEMGCPKNPQTGLPESVTAVFVQGQVNVMIAQVAFRRAPTADDGRLVAHVVGSMKVCSLQAMPACQGRKAAGFVAAR